MEIYVWKKFIYLYIYLYKYVHTLTSLLSPYTKLQELTLISPFPNQWHRTQPNVYLLSFHICNYFYQQRKPYSHSHPHPHPCHVLLTRFEPPHCSLGCRAPLHNPDKCLSNLSPYNKFSLPGGSDDKESACNAGGQGFIPGLRRSSGEGNGNPLQFSCLENSMERNLTGYLCAGLQRVRNDWVTNTFTFNKFRTKLFLKEREGQRIKGEENGRWKEGNENFKYVYSAYFSAV